MLRITRKTETAGKLYCCVQMGITCATFVGVYCHNFVAIRQCLKSLSQSGPDVHICGLITVCLKLPHNPQTLKANSAGGNTSRPFTATAVCVTTAQKYQGCTVRNVSTDNTVICAHIWMGKKSTSSHVTWRLGCNENRYIHVKYCF